MVISITATGVLRSVFCHYPGSLVLLMLYCGNHRSVQALCDPAKHSTISEYRVRVLRVYLQHLWRLQIASIY
ncbi:MAG: hypothetical protein ACPG7F_13530 [Aggregatilineales bacterium]